MTFGADPGGESPAEIGACPSTVFWLPFSSENWSPFQPESAQTSHPQMGMQLTAKTAPEWRSIPSGIHADHSGRGRSGANRVEVAVVAGTRP